MILRLGALLGLPAGTPDPGSDAAALRYALLALCLLWAIAAARSRPRLALLAGVVFVEAAFGFWVLALSRPYGLLVDPDTTRWAAQISVAAASRDPGRSFLAGESAAPTLWSALAARGVRRDALLLVPTLLPLLVLPALAVLIHLLWAQRERAALAALLWLAFSTGDLDTLAGVGFVPGLWSHPRASVAVVLVAGAVLALGRRFSGMGSAAVGAGLVALAGAVLAPAAAHPRGLVDTLLLLTLHQGPWLLLALVGLARGGTDAAARALLVGGATLVTAGALPLPVDPWAAQALYRMGLVLTAAEPVEALAHGVGETLSRSPRIAPWGTPRGLGVAAILLATVPGSFLAWWDPTRLDAVAEASLEGLSPRVLGATAWIRRHTSADAVFLASADYAPAVAVLGCRRVLRAPGLAADDDDGERLRLKRRILSGREAEALAREYGLGYVFTGPGEPAVDTSGDAAGRERFRLLYDDPDGLRVYEILRASRVE